MTPRILLGSALVLAAAAFAPAIADAQSDRDLKTVTAQLEKGERIFARAAKYERKAAQLYAYDQAAAQFMSARRTAARWAGPAFASAWNNAGAGLVRAYDAQAEIYYNRGSLPAARKHVAAALAIDDSDIRARNLMVMIEAAEETDILDKNVGEAALDRIRERRAASGMPLRERGVTPRQ